MMAHDHYVEFAGVEKSYDGKNLVVQDLDLAIAKGEFLTMLGPSGSGKTTSLMMLAGFEAPSRGEIRLAGRSIEKVPPHRRNIGMVFQNYALFPHLTVAGNLAYPLQVRKIAKADIATRVDRALDMVQMRQYGARRPSQLSGGQQQRVALARALVFEPDLVLMDEPLGALDKNLREHLQFEIKHLHARLGVTVVYVTHDQSEALTMSDRIAVFNAGRVEQLATPATLYENPKTAFVAGFIGENNRLEGTLTSIDGASCLVSLAGGRSLIAESKNLRLCDLGSSVLISLRPERVRVGNDAEGLANRLEGEIAEIIYLGDHIRLHLDPFLGTRVVAKIPNIGGRPDIQVGERLVFGWAAGDCVVLTNKPPN
jgi:putative spermidine/putrescine transport system ATP-binding protein